MGKDLVAGGRNTKHQHRKDAKSKNVYLNILCRLFEFLSRRVPDSAFNKVVLRRLRAPNTTRPPVGVARLARWMAGKEDKVAVFVGTITDDVRLTGRSVTSEPDGPELRPLKVAALRITAGAKARILKAGGEVMTLDELARINPTGSNTVLLRGRRTARKANKHFGTPVHGDAVPFVRAKTRKHEMARGRRGSRGFKV